MRFCLYLIVLSTLARAAGVPGAGSGAGNHVAFSARVVPVVRADPRSGQIVKTISITPKPAENSRASTPRPLAPALNVKDLVAESAKANDVAPELVDSVIQVESNYNPYAVSPKGAQGLMQLMPATARRFGVKDTFDPKQNIEGGVRYLKFLQDTFQDDRLAIAAYNAGEKAVQKYGTVPPYPETLNYVVKVGSKYGKAKRAAIPVKPATTAAVTPVIPEYRKLAEHVDAEGKLYLTTQ